MKAQRTIYRKGVIINYSITDNVCSICAHNPERMNYFDPFLDGKCDKFNPNVVECCDLAIYGDSDLKPILGKSKLSELV